MSDPVPVIPPQPEPVCLRNVPYKPQEGFCRPTRIVAASILKGDRLWAGKRHAELMNQIRQDLGETTHVDWDEQGFLTDTGHHCMRKAAMCLCWRYGQIPEGAKTYQKEDLFSEDLWPKS